MSDADELWELRRDPDIESRRLDWVSSLRREPAASEPIPGIASTDVVGMPSATEVIAAPGAVTAGLAETPEVTEVIALSNIGPAGPVEGSVVTEAIARSNAGPAGPVERSVSSVRPIDDGRATAQHRAMSAARRRHRRRRGRVRRAAFGVVVTAIGYLGVNFWQVWRTGLADGARAVDAIVVLGAAQYDGRPSPQLAARLDHAVDLYRFGIAPLIVVTGGNQPGDRFTEASASADYLSERGVPAEALLLEDRGRSTWQSLDAVDALLDERGLNSVVLVTDPYHSLRSQLTAEEAGLVAYASPTRSSPVQGGSAWWREAKEAAGVAVGRVSGFERLSRLTD